MPALSTYSPFETLVFFQNVAYYGADTTSLQTISTALNQNQLIRESEDYDASKFSPDALHHLYNRTINAQDEAVPNGINGDSKPANGNSLKRKLSTSPAPTSTQDTVQAVQQFVDTLYAKFKEESIKELRQQEQEYRRLQDEIKTLENQIKNEDATNAQKVKSSTENAEGVQTSSKVPIERQDPVSAQLQADLEAVNHEVKSPARPVSVQPQAHQQPHPITSQSHEAPQPAIVPSQRSSTPKSSSTTPLPRHSQPPPSQNQHQSPRDFNRTLPPPSPQRNSYGPLPPPPHAYPSHPQNQPQMLPPIHNLQRMPSHEGYPPRAHTQGRGSPMPQHPPQGYPQYPQYQQPPPHAWPSPGPQQYSQPHYPPQQHYTPQPPARYAQVHTPNQPPYPSYPHTPPIAYQNQVPQQHWRGPPIPQYHQYPASTSNTPMPRPDSRATVFRSGGSTPWKRRTIPTGFRPRSPSRLDREVSPISDSGSPPPEAPIQSTERPVKTDALPTNKPLTEVSATSAGHLSRSQSVVSTTSEPQNPPKRRPGRPPKIKPEPKPEPSTPVQTSDSEQQQKSSGRRGRARTSTLSNKPDPSRNLTTTKRKRDAPSASPIPRGRSMSHVQAPMTTKVATQHSDPNFVVVSKSFGRTSQLLLNEITSHKLAGIFAKPLSERDAPGYKSLILRPQDLKSVKAAISKGSRAAISAIEKLESENADDGNDPQRRGEEVTSAPAIKVTSSSASTQAGNVEGPIGNGFYYVSATEDLIPPKGIVNSAQLEMELVRMFANAVMFNPLPTSERGFGRSLRLRKRGGELPQYGARNKQSTDIESETPTEEGRSESESATVTTGTSETESSAPGADEGGIIADAREMFADVEKLVARWRDLEGGSVGNSQGSFSTPVASGTSGAERHASVSASSVAGEDEGDGGTPSASFAGSVRKRRKVGDR